MYTKWPLSASVKGSQGVQAQVRALASAASRGCEIVKLDSVQKGVGHVVRWMELKRSLLFKVEGTFPYERS